MDGLADERVLLVMSLFTVALFIAAPIALLCVVLWLHKRERDRTEPQELIRRARDAWKK